MIQWALSVDSCLRRNDRIWIWVIGTERGKSAPEPNQQGSEQKPLSYTKHSAFNVFAILTKSEDLLPRVGD
jgi:hypothetical protein